MQRIYNYAFEELKRKADLPENANVKAVVEHYRRLAEDGNAEAQCAMGVLCCIGVVECGVPAYIPDGVKVSDRSHIAMDGTVLYAVGTDYLDVMGEHQNFVEAAKWYRLAADQGHGWACLLLGDCYYSAEGVKKDYEEAYHYYLSAVECSIPKAFCRLGHLYYSGEAVEQSYDEALEWYRVGVEAGDRDAFYCVGECYAYGEGVEMCEETAYQYYRKAAYMGSGDGLYRYADCFYYGRGTEQSFNIAAQLYEKAAKLEDRWAQCAYGICCYMGEGVEANKELAMKWYALSAAHGCFDASWRLGDGYRDDIGVDRDLERARLLYQQALEQCGNPAAGGWAIIRQRLGNLYLFSLDCSEEEEKLAVQYLQQAAEHGNEEAVYDLALCYRSGIGVEADEKKATEYFKRFIDEFENGREWLFGETNEGLCARREANESIEEEYYFAHEELLANALSQMNDINYRQKRRKKMFEIIGYKQIKMHIGKRAEILFVDERRIIGTLLGFFTEDEVAGERARIIFLPENADEPLVVFENEIDFMWLRIDGMVNAVPYLTDQQVEFICKECRITEEELHSFDEDTLYDKVYDVMCDIECEEIPLDDDEEESERCILASDIVTLLGNALAEAEGYYDEQDALEETNEEG